MKKNNFSKTIAIIPVFRDNTNLEKVLKRFNETFVDEICIVVDCAKKNQTVSFQNPAHIPLHVISNHERKGIGHALRQGLKYSIKKGFDIVVILAGNNKDDPQEIPRLLEPILNDGCSYVQGSRFMSGGKHINNPHLRGIFSKLYPFIWTLCTKVRCTDVTNGFRAYKLSLFDDERIDIWQNWLNNYELEYYIHYKALTLGYKTTEVPVTKTYSHRNKGGYSQISPFRDWWKIVGPLIYLVTGARK